MRFCIAEQNALRMLREANGFCSQKGPLVWGIWVLAASAKFQIEDNRGQTNLLNDEAWLASIHIPFLKNKIK